MANFGYDPNQMGPPFGGLPMMMQMQGIDPFAAEGGMAAPPVPADPGLAPEMAAPALPERAPMPSLAMDPQQLMSSPMTPEQALSAPPPLAGSPAGPTFEVPKPFSRKRYGGIFDNYFAVQQGGAQPQPEDPNAGGQPMLLAGQGMGGGPVAGSPLPAALPGGAPANPFAAPRPNPVLARYPRLDRMVRRVYRYDPAADPARRGM